MGKITDYSALSSTQPDDVVPIVDVHDFTQAGTGTTKKITVTNLLATAGGLANPMTAVGDTIYGGTAGSPTRLPGDTSNTRKLLRTQSSAGVAAAPAWDVLQAGDIPNLGATYPRWTDVDAPGGVCSLDLSTKVPVAELPSATTSGAGIVQLDGTAADITVDGDQTAGATGKAADAGHVHSAFSWTPADNGLLVASFDPLLGGSTGTIAVAGTVYVIKVPIHRALTWTTLWLGFTAAGVGASTGSFVGLYNSSGTRLTVSADTGAPAVGTFSIALGAAQALSAGSFVWAACVFNLATTLPTFYKAQTGSLAVASVNLTAANLRVAVAGTGQTSLPASFTPSALVTTNAIPLWVGGS